MRFFNFFLLFLAFLSFAVDGDAFAERGFFPEVDVFYSLRDGSITQDWDIFIDDKGMITLVEKDFYHSLRPPINIKSKKLPPAELVDFKNFILASDVFQFEDYYVGSADAMDWASKKLKFNIGKMRKEIVISVSDIPRGLEDIIHKIENIKERTFGPHKEPD